MKYVLLSIFWILVILANSQAQNSSQKKKSTCEISIGYSRFFVDPEVRMELAGLSGDFRLHFGKKSQDYITRGLFKVREIAVMYSQIFGGRIDARAMALSYGRRYELSRLYFSYGFGPYSYGLFSNDKIDAISRYSLDTGLRFYAYYLLGYTVRFSGKWTVGVNLKYNFTIKNLYWHNPIRPHKHKDIFHYLTLGIGLKQL